MRASGGAADIDTPGAVPIAHKRVITWKWVDAVVLDNKDISPAKASSFSFLRLAKEEFS